MVVTNLFQVSTLTEACYLGMASGTPKAFLFATSGAFGLGLGWLGSLILLRRTDFDRRSRRRRSANADEFPSRIRNRVLVVADRFDRRFPAAD